MESLVIRDGEVTPEWRIPVEEVLEPYQSYQRMRTRVHNEEERRHRSHSPSSIIRRGRSDRHERIKLFAGSLARKLPNTFTETMELSHKEANVQNYLKPKFKIPHIGNLPGAHPMREATTIFIDGDQYYECHVDTDHTAGKFDLKDITPLNVGVV